MKLVGFTGLAGSGKDTVASLLRLEMAAHGDMMYTYAFAKPLKQLCAKLFDVDEKYFHDQVLKTKPIKFVFQERRLRVRFDWAMCDLIDLYSDKKNTIGKNVQELKMRYWKNDCPYLDDEALLKSLYQKFYSILGIQKCIPWYSKFLFWKEEDSSNQTVTVTITPRQIMQLVGTDVIRNYIADDMWTTIAPTEEIIYTDVRFLDEAVHTKNNDGVIIQVVNRLQKDSEVMNHQSELEVNKILADYIIDNSGNDMNQLVSEVEALVEKMYAKQ